MATACGRPATCVGVGGPTCVVGMRPGQRRVGGGRLTCVVGMRPGQRRASAGGGPTCVVIARGRSGLGRHRGGAHRGTPSATGGVEARTEPVTAEPRPSPVIASRRADPRGSRLRPGLSGPTATRDDPLRRSLRFRMNLTLILVAAAPIHVGRIRTWRVRGVRVDARPPGRPAPRAAPLSSCRPTWVATSARPTACTSGEITTTVELHNLGDARVFRRLGATTSSSSGSPEALVATVCSSDFSG
jgi:hypothetical protein